MRTAQQACATMSMTPEGDPDNYTNKLTRLRNLLTDRRDTSRHVAYIVLQALTEDYRDVKLLLEGLYVDLPKHSVCATSPLPGLAIEN